jgi:chromosome partitioning protein
MTAMGRITAMLNQKGGVGKTTVTLGLASAAAAAGHRVLVVDLDPQGSSTWVLGHDPDADGSSAADATTTPGGVVEVVETTWGPEVDLVPASPTLYDGRRLPDTLRRALSPVADKYDAVLLDCPPALGDLTIAALSAADLAVIVVDPAALGLRGIGAVADAIDTVWETTNSELELAGVIVNRMPAVSSEAERRYDELARIVGRKAIWQPPVPQRVIVNQAIGERRPIHSYGARSVEVSEAFDTLWAKLRRASRL